MVNQPFMNFEIREKVKHYNGGQSFQELSSLELEPIVKIYDSDKQIEISGHLVLSGEFLKKEDNWEEQIDQADGIHYGTFFIRDKEIETFQHQIPISFDIQLNRVENPSQVYVLVENFDYNILSDEEMELTANIKLVGVHPEPAQESEAYLENYHNDEDYQSNDEESAYKTVDEEAVQDEQEESEEVTIQASPTIEETAVIPDQQEKNKMKIGIQGKNRVAMEKETEIKKENPLYSLLKREQKKDIGQVEVKEEDVNEQLEVKAEDNVEKAKQENIVISMEDYLNDKEEDIKSAIDVEQVHAQEIESQEDIQEDNQAVPGAKTTTTARSTKDMLYNLLQGNEEKKFKLKIYLVQKEDTLDLVAEKYDLKREDLLKHNSLPSRDLQEGQLLYLPMER